MTGPVAPDRRLLRMTACGFFLLTLVLGLLSEGVYHDDDLTHFLIARWSRWYPEYLLHIWGRPGFTVPVAAVSWMNNVDVAWHGARVLSACISLLAALAAVRLAAQLGVARPRLAVLFCYAQPLYVVLATTTLTENFAALYLTAALCLFYSRRIVAASLIFSLTLLTRHEAVVFLPIWMIALAVTPHTTASWKRRIAAAAATLWAPVVHNLLFFAVFQRWPAEMFLRPTGSTEYPAAGMLSYLPDAAYAATPLILGLALIGAAKLIQRGEWLIPVLAGAFFMTHVLVKAIGVFASGGYGRFLVSISPLLAICALAGWNHLRSATEERSSGAGGWIAFTLIWLLVWWAMENAFDTGRFEVGRDVRTATRVAAVVLIASCAAMIVLHRSGRMRFAATGLLGLTCAVQWCILVRPLGPQEDQLLVSRVVAWHEKNQPPDTPILATNPWFSYYFKLVEHPRAHKGDALLASMPEGTIFYWDSKYSESDFHRLNYHFISEIDGTELLETFRTIVGRPLKVAAFRMNKPQQVASEELDMPFYPRDLAAEARPVHGIYYLRPAAE